LLTLGATLCLPRSNFLARSRRELDSAKLRVNILTSTPIDGSSSEVTQGY